MGNSLINLGNISKPATALIDRVSEAVGGIAKPWQIKRVAIAEAEVLKIVAKANLEVSEFEARGLKRLITEEGMRQENIENITAKAIPNLDTSANPESIETDWLNTFFDRARLISDDAMQSLWANILASEANKPGKFSKRTIHIISTLDKLDAQLFTKFCGFCWVVDEDSDWLPVILNYKSDIYKDAGLNYSDFQHLENIGLISFRVNSGFSYSLSEGNDLVRITYFQDSIEIQLKDDEKLSIGSAIFTQAGRNLAPISGASPVDGFVDFCMKQWTGKRIKVL